MLLFFFNEFLVFKRDSIIVILVTIESTLGHPNPIETLLLTHKNKSTQKSQFHQIKPITLFVQSHGFH